MINPTTPKGQLVFYKWIDKVIQSPFLDFEIQRLSKRLTTKEKTAIANLTEIPNEYKKEFLYQMLFMYYSCTNNPSKGNVYSALKAAPNKSSFTVDWVKTADEHFKQLNHHLAELKIDSIEFHPRMLYSAIALSDLLLK